MTPHYDPPPPDCIRCAWKIPMPGFPDLSVASSMMIVCPECGNKRCPRATHHDFVCTGSNEPGQAGSVYQ